MIGRTALVIFDGRGDVNPVLALWAKRFPNVARVSQLGIDQTAPIHQQRNAVWQQWLTTSTTDWLLMVDDDMIPTALTEPLLSSHRLMAGARYWGRIGKESHAPDGEVGCGCLRVNRLAADLLGPDPFTPNPGECECSAFCRRCREAGIWPAKLGRIGHCIGVYVMPGETADDDYRIMFPDAPKPKKPPGDTDVPASLGDNPKCPILVTAAGSVLLPT